MTSNISNSSKLSICWCDRRHTQNIYKLEELVNSNLQAKFGPSFNNKLDHIYGLCHSLIDLASDPEYESQIDAGHIHIDKE